MVYSKVRTSIALFNEGVKYLHMMIFVSLLDNVDKVNEISDVDMLDPLTVLDEQGDVEIDLCDLL